MSSGVFKDHTGLGLTDVVKSRGITCIYPGCQGTHRPLGGNGAVPWHQIPPTKIDWLTTPNFGLFPESSKADHQRRPCQTKKIISFSFGPRNCCCLHFIHPDSVSLFITNLRRLIQLVVDFHHLFRCTQPSILSLFYLQFHTTTDRQDG